MDFSTQRAIREMVTDASQELARNLGQALAPNLDSVPYHRGQSVWLTFMLPDSSSIQGTVVDATALGLILEKTRTISYPNLFMRGPVFIPWSSIAMVSVDLPSSECSWMEAAPED